MSDKISPDTGNQFNLTTTMCASDDVMVVKEVPGQSWTTQNNQETKL